MPQTLKGQHKMQIKNECKQKPYDSSNHNFLYDPAVYVTIQWIGFKRKKLNVRTIDIKISWTQTPKSQIKP